MHATDKHLPGYTIVELLAVIVLGALLLTAMTGVVNTALESQRTSEQQLDASQALRFAMQRIRFSILATDQLILPLADNPATDWQEHIREQTVPASPPEGSSTLATAVLALALGPEVDLDEDGAADADNDGDGRVDEDFSQDATNDQAHGIVGIDDDGDGSVDEGTPGNSRERDGDDDEQGNFLEDLVDGIDNDGDGAIDEDAGADMNDDGAPGIAGFDDDGDLLVDEGNDDDDDEDGDENEDWLDVVVFYLNDDQLIERRPDIDPDDGNDFTEYVIAQNISRFRVERISSSAKRATLIDVSVSTVTDNGQTITASIRMRVGDVE